MSIFHLGKPNGRKPSNLRLEIIILRLEYNEERKRKIWKCFPKMETLKTVFFCSVCELLSLPKNYTLLWAVVLLLCKIMRRGASYLYCFPTQNLTRADFTWGSNIILYFIIYILFFYCWLFTPRLTLFFLGFVWMITTSSTPDGGQ